MRLKPCKRRKNQFPCPDRLESCHPGAMAPLLGVLPLSRSCLGPAPGPRSQVWMDTAPPFEPTAPEKLDSLSRASCAASAATGLKLTPEGRGETGGGGNHALAWKMAVPAEKKEAGPRMHLSRACGLPTALPEETPIDVFFPGGVRSSS